MRALFRGPSGTGKTLAARLLAAVLQMDLYRLDLSSVVNKYIGETEKNLDRVLSRAEELDVILLSIIERLPDVRLDPVAEPPTYVGLLTRSWEPLNVAFSPV